MFKAAITFGGRMNVLHLISNNVTMLKCANELMENVMREEEVWLSMMEIMFFYGERGEGGVRFIDRIIDDHFLNVKCNTSLTLFLTHRDTVSHHRQLTLVFL